MRDGLMPDEFIPCTKSRIITVGIRARYQVVYQRERWGIKRSGLWDPKSVGEGNEEFECGNLSFNIRVLKALLSTAIRNGSNRTISISGGLRLLQMISELATGRCKTLVEVRLDSLHSRRVLKSWDWRRYVMGQSEQYLLAVGLYCYKWYQSRRLGGVLAKTLGVTVMPVQGLLPMAACPWQAKPLSCLFILVFFLL